LTIFQFSFDNFSIYVMSFNIKEARLADRNQATAFFQAREAGASLITKKWVANRLKRSGDWVKQNWRKKPLDCFSDFSKYGHPARLSQASKDLILAGVGLQRKSCRELATRGEKRDPAKLKNYQRKTGKCQEQVNFWSGFAYDCAVRAM
jgi:hypothetical protein